MPKPPPAGAAKPRGRRPHRQQALLREIRQLIDTMPAGGRLPIRTELQRRFGASCITIQRVIDRFVDQGLLEARGSQGTFVAARPPHLHRIALVFPFGPQADGRWKGYYQALRQAAAQLRLEGVDLRPVMAHEHRQQTAEFAALQETCRDGLIAGLIFASPPEVWAGTPVGDAPIARVGLSHTQRTDVARVHPDHDSFIQRAAQTLAARGCRRPALIANVETTEAPEVVARWERFFAEAGIPLRPQWLLGCPLEWPGNATRLARLLCSSWAGERPDGLVVADDAFEEPVLAGLMSEGVRVGTDMRMVALANFPLGSATTLPVIRLGFDVAALLRQAVARIQVLRAGGAAEPFLLPATFPDGSWGG